MIDSLLSECRPILDADGLIVGILGAIPEDDGWGEVLSSAEAVIEEARGRLQIPNKYKNHRRGTFPALSVGLSHGGGQGVSLCTLYYLAL